jgi:DNA-binding NtrC family response regulator
VTQPAENCPETGGFLPRPTVLLVDDEPLIRWSLGEAIREAGFGVRLAASGADAEEALAALDSQRLIVLLDLRLPDVVDLSLLETLRSRRPDAPVLVLSAWASADVVDAVLKAGAAKVMKKPFDVASVVSAVREASPVAGPAYTF